MRTAEIARCLKESKPLREDTKDMWIWLAMVERFAEQLQANDPEFKVSEFYTECKYPAHVCRHHAAE